MASELSLYRDTVRPEWVDYNGHMRDAFYLLVFSFATDALMDAIGLDAAGRAASHSSIYTLESHLNYLQEVKLGTKVQVQTRLLGADAKRLHVYQEMLVQGREGAVAVCEQMLLHVDVRGPKSAPFQAAVMACVQAMAAKHCQLARPVYVGRVMRLP
ncbi:thioesterase family protein [Rhodoferax sp.]|uniref:thioesterase family protein n=1 Tax=Rhodoferax sp. TaxID=50421 RepID=UPI00374C92CD